MPRIRTRIETLVAKALNVVTFAPQIRKMIGMGLAVVRGEAPEAALVAALEGPLLLPAPLAPSEGECPGTSFRFWHRSVRDSVAAEVE